MYKHLPYFVTVVSEQLFLLLPQEEGFPRLMEQPIISDAAFLSLRDEVAELRTLLSLPEMQEALANLKKGQEELAGPLPPEAQNVEQRLAEPISVRSRSHSRERVSTHPHSHTHSRVAPASRISRGSNPNYSPNFSPSHSRRSHSHRSKGEAVLRMHTSADIEENMQPLLFIILTANHILHLLLHQGSAIKRNEGLLESLRLAIRMSNLNPNGKLTLQKPSISSANLRWLLCMRSLQKNPTTCNVSY